VAKRFSLRERKYARTKSDLLYAVLTALRDRPLDEVAVREICESLQLSEATFYNYFPSKLDVLAYFLQLWSIRVDLRARDVLQETLSGLRMIEAVFDETASMVAPYPGVMYELVAYYARGTARGAWPTLSGAEVALHFPQLDGSLPIEHRDLYVMLTEGLRQAVESSELPQELDTDLIVVMLMDIFFATYVTARQLGLDPDHIRGLYKRQLDLLWIGVRAHATISKVIPIGGR
jgi:AcrR family transcriptional regulator